MTLALDAAVAALALSASLYALRLALVRAESVFPTLALLLAVSLALQTAGRSVRAGPGALRLGLASARAQLPAVAASGALVLAQSYARADALAHFGALFAFLLERVGELLLPQALDYYRQQQQQSPRSYSSYSYGYDGRHRASSAAAASACALAVAGYLAVAGVDAVAYGSLVRAAALLALALGAKALEQRPSARVAAASCPLLRELSTAGALALAAPAAWLSRAVGSALDANASARAEAEAVAPSLEWWLVAVVAAAAAQHAAAWLDSRQRSASASGRVRGAGATVLTGWLLALAAAAAHGQDDWLLRGALDAAACLALAYAALIERRSPSAKLSDLDVGLGPGDAPPLDAYREAPGRSEVARVLASLWAKEDSRKILLFLSVNVSYMFVELAVGWWSNSLGLMGDAGHMLFDNSALVIGLVAAYVGQLPPDARFTFGYGRVEVLSGFLNSLLLLLIAGHLLLEAAARFLDPPEVATDHLLLTSVVGLLVNLVGLVWFHDAVHGHGHGHDCSHGHGHSHSHGHSHGHGQAHGDDEGPHAASSNSNMHGVYLHVLADTLGSVGVIASSLAIQAKGWHVADPLSSAAIALLIAGSTLPLLKETLLQLLQRVPRGQERAVAAALAELGASVPGLERVERWHVWQHAQDVLVGSLALVAAPAASEQLVLARAREIMRRRTGMDAFLTVQVRKRGVGELPGGSTGAFEPLASPLLPPPPPHAHAHDRRELYTHAHGHGHGHDHDHRHAHWHDEAPPSAMSTHENPVSEDVRFGLVGLGGSVGPPAALTSASVAPTARHHHALGSVAADARRKRL